jgi:phage/plasmid-associated DNA primase
MSSLATFLKSHVATPGVGYTHTRIGDKMLNVYGGVFNIPDEDYPEFWQLYSQHIQSGKQEFLTEKQYPDVGPLVVDLDFHYAPEIDCRQHTEEDIENIVGLYAEHLAEMVCGELPTYDIFVSHKSTVNMLDEKTKDGIHIFFSVRVPRIIQKALRAVMLEMLPQTLEHLPLENSWDGVLDEGITNGGTNWQLLGSRKPGNKAYEITHGFRVTGVEISPIDIGIIDKSKISVRCKKFPMVSANTSNDAIMTLMSRKTTPSSSISPKQRIGLSSSTDTTDASAFIASIPAEKSGPFQTWASYVCMLVRKYRDTKTDAELRDIIHEFSRKDKSYDENKVDDWISKYDDTKFPEDMRFPEREASAITAEVREASRQILAQEVVTAAIETPEQVNMFMSPSLLSLGILGVCEHITPEVRKYVRYCNDRWYCYDTIECLWNISKDPTHLFIKILNKYLNWNIANISTKLASVEIADDEAARLSGSRKLFIAALNEFDKSSTSSQMKKHFQHLINEKDFTSQLDNHKDCLVFADGIYNMKTQQFRKGLRYDDMLSFKLPYKYREATTTDKERAKNIIMKICSNQEWRYEYYVKALGYALTGNATAEQIAFFLIGRTASNGKSTPLEILTKMLPCYVRKMNPETFADGNKDFHKNIKHIIGARIAWFNEIGKRKINIELLKDVCDGSQIQNKVLYGTEETIKIDAKLFFVGNSEPKFATDNGIARRYRYIEFKSKFYDRSEFDNIETKREDFDFLKDPEVPKFLESENGIFAFLSCLFDGAALYYKHGLVTPAEYDELKQQAIAKNDKYHEFIINHITTSSGKCIHKSQFETAWGTTGQDGVYKWDEFSDALLKRGFAYNPRKQKKINGKLLTGCFVDIDFENMETINSQDD